MTGAPERVKTRATICVAIALACGMYLSKANGQDRSDERRNMVATQIASRGIENEAVLQAMQAVPRHLFVPEDSRRAAYGDHPIAIGYGQTISQPYIVAFMTEAIRPGSDHKVLEIGTGSGYQAAVLAEIVEDVYTIEIVPELGEVATKRLSDLEYDNVHIKVGDGYFGWVEEAPFDAIIVTAAAGHIPPPLLAQLKEGGHMIIPVGTPFLVQSLVFVRKRDGETTTQSLMPVRFVPFTRAKQ